MSEKLNDALSMIGDAVAAANEKRSLKNARAARQLSLLQSPCALAEALLTSYFASVEGFALSEKKANYAVEMMLQAAKSGESIKLIESYADYRKRTGNAMWQATLPGDEVACWCPKTIADTDEAFIILEKLSDIRQMPKLISDKQREATDSHELASFLDAAAKEEAFRDAIPMEKKQSVAEFAASCSSPAMFDIRDERCAFIGFYNSRDLSHGAEEAVKHTEVINDGTACWCTVYVKNK